MSKGAPAKARRVRNAFTVELSSLLRSPGSRQHVQRQAPIADLVVSGSRVEDDEPVELDVILESVHEGILVSGRVRARWHGACRRCLEEAEGELDVELRELVVEGGDDESVYGYTGTRLDLAPLAHDACILELPLAPLCREDCLGLCPECGVNRNLEPCSCRPRPDDRWSGLAGLYGGGPDGGPMGAGEPGETKD